MNQKTISDEIYRLMPGAYPPKFRWEGDMGPAIYWGGRAALLPLDDDQDIEFARSFLKDVLKRRPQMFVSNPKRSA